MVAVLEGTEITAVFDNSNHLTGSAGCNSYNGDYTATTDTMGISNVSTTNMTCGTPPGIMEQEAAYLANLPLTTHYQIRGNVLQLVQFENGRELILMEYEANE